MHLPSRDDRGMVMHMAHRRCAKENEACLFVNRDMQGQALSTPRIVPVILPQISSATAGNPSIPCCRAGQLHCRVQTPPSASESAAARTIAHRAPLTTSTLCIHPCGQVTAPSKCVAATGFAVPFSFKQQCFFSCALPVILHSSGHNRPLRLAPPPPPKHFFL